ncbi:MAG: hypothetical protein J6U65_00840 [Bacteroidaceae bacterium]|nr:hypothetical protein [Bacteroidaceae bacterium]
MPIFFILNGALCNFRTCKLVNLMNYDAQGKFARIILPNCRLLGGKIMPPR